MFLDKPRDLWRDRNSRLGQLRPDQRRPEERRAIKLVSQHLFAIFAYPWRRNSGRSRKGQANANRFAGSSVTGSGLLGGDGFGAPAPVSDAGLPGERRKIEGRRRLARVATERKTRSSATHRYSMNLSWISLFWKVSRNCRGERDSEPRPSGATR
jgi:hypothetical protein